MEELYAQVGNFIYEATAQAKKPNCDKHAVVKMNYSKLRQISCATLICLVLCSCGAQEPSSADSASKHDGLTIIQGDRRINLKGGVKEVILDSAPFSLEFELFPYTDEAIGYSASAAQIASTDNEKNLVHFQEGPISKDNPFYAPASGMAARLDQPYEEMFVGDDGMHFVFYSNPTERRADLVEEKSNGKLRLRWDIERVSINQMTIQMAELSIKTLFMMVYIPGDNDDIIEDGEYDLVKIRLLKPNQ